MNIDALIADLKKEEGFVPYAYADSRGFLTIGSGILIDKRGGGITEEENDYLMMNRIQKLIATLDAKLPWLRYVSEVRQRAFAEMAYQMGIEGLLEFKKMIAAVRNDAWDEVVKQAMDSAWAMQTPNRARRVAQMLKMG